MHRAALALVVVVGACGSFASDAAAGVTMTVKTRSYVVSGATGAALLGAMDRHGPKHGFLTRAIAQTRYTIAWKMEWGETRTACRVRRVDGELAITYTYPRLEGPISRDLQRRWHRFIRGVQRHEEMHGTLARQMVKQAERSVSKVSIRNDRQCRQARREVKRRIDAIYAEYEMKQVAFDAREHRDGGPVEGLIAALVQER